MRRKYVHKTTGLRRYRFPTHANELVYDRSVASSSEVFVVVLEPGEAPPMHVHDDTEQVFYMLEGRGTLKVGKRPHLYRVEPGDVILVPPQTPHSVVADSGERVRYLAVDCFGAGGAPREGTWDEHVRAVCRQHGWDFRQVTGKA